MVALTAKNLSLPHLSLSRTSSPSRSNSLNSSAPPTPGSATSTAPTSPTVPNSSTPSFFSLDRKKSKSTSPKHRPVESNLTPVDPSLPPLSSPATTTLHPTNAREATDKYRRSSFGASLSAFSSSRSSSPAATKSSTIPAGLSLTPASAQLSTTQTGGGVAADPGHGTAAAASTSGGFKPLQAAIAKSAGVVKDRSGALLMRSKSSDRAEGIAAASTAFQDGAAGAATKRKGVMGAVRGLALGQSVSQPAQSRAPGAGSSGPSLPVRSSSTYSAGASTHSGSTTPTTSTAADSGTSALASSNSATSGQRSSSAQVHRLAESHVSQISLRMSETVNKVFMPSAHGQAGLNADKLEGAFFVPSSAIQEATGGKGRPCPRVVKSREFGEMLVAELRAANHDSYLLRTILRSSVLKALSLFLSRLSALLLIPSSPSDPAFQVPVALSTAKDAKVQESDSHFASHFPLALRYNLHIARCATTVKQYLLELATTGGGGTSAAFPAFVEETLRPWRGKLTELVARVMTPVVASYKAAVVEACNKGRTEGEVVDGAAVTRARANSGERLSGGGASALGLNVAAVANGGSTRSSSQGRSLSLGRSSAPTPLSLASGPTTAPGGAGGGSASHGPSWLQDVTTIFDVCAKLFARLDAKMDTDRWAVGIAIAATWKGMLACSARIISEDGTVPASIVPAAINPSTPIVPAPVKSRLLGGVKKTPSPPPSPPLAPISLLGSTASASSTTPTLHAPLATVAFVRLIADLELFERRLVAFLTATLSSPAVVFHPSAAPVDPCPVAPSCGLCKTGRTFDEESDSSDDDGPRDQGVPGQESRLALSAMREAMQALSSMIVVVRSSRDLDVFEQALKSDMTTTTTTTVAAAGADATAADPSRGLTAAVGVAKPTGAPLTPSDLFALGPTKPNPPKTTTTTSQPPPSITVVSPCPAHPSCPTLRSALIDLHPLILVHLVLSRVPRSLAFRLPHQVWQLAGGWHEYVEELRGFAAGEEWAGEVAWEVRGEVVRVRQEVTELREVEDRALRVLEETVERVSRDSV